jgi:branched-chain amino acid transport system permease protein
MQRFFACLHLALFMLKFLSNYSSVIVSMLLEAMLGLSLYLPLMAGQLSLASPGFYALGGYVAAIFSTKVITLNPGQSFPIAFVVLEMLIAGLLCGILGILVGIPALKLRGIYLAIATIAFVETLRVLAINDVPAFMEIWVDLANQVGLSLSNPFTEPITGGAVGIFGIPQPFPTLLDYLWIVLPLLLLSIAFFYRLEKIRVGRALIAIREDELAADAMGINPAYFKVLAFTLGAILAGMVGVVKAHFLNVWNPRQSTFDASIIYLTIVLIGGSRTFWGPILGGIVLTAVPEVLRASASIAGLPTWLAQFLREGRLTIFGVLIVLGTIFFPQGWITPERLSKPPKQKSRSET